MEQPNSNWPPAVRVQHVLVRVMILHAAVGCCPGKIRQFVTMKWKLCGRQLVQALCSAWGYRAAQDLTALNIDLAAVTQASGWKLTRMPLQYGGKINAAGSGMARAAAVMGRDKADPEEG